MVFFFLEKDVQKEVNETPKRKSVKRKLISDDDDDENENEENNPKRHKMQNGSSETPPKSKKKLVPNDFSEHSILQKNKIEQTKSLGQYRSLYSAEISNLFSDDDDFEETLHTRSKNKRKNRNIKVGSSLSPIADDSLESSDSETNILFPKRKSKVTEKLKNYRSELLRISSKKARGEGKKSSQAEESNLQETKEDGNNNKARRHLPSPKGKMNEGDEERVQKLKSPAKGKKIIVTKSQNKNG